MPDLLPIDDDCVLYAGVPQNPHARRQMVCRFLANRLGRGSREVTLSATPAGQPVIEGHDGLAVSWSHRAGFLLIGMARVRVGVDLEDHRAFPMAGVVATFFSRNERLAFGRVAPAARLPAFYLLWTLRESCLKALGTGLDAPVAKELDFSAVIREHMAPDEVAQPLRVSLFAQGWMLSRLVCVKGQRLRVAKITAT
jgi:phosphopantetheinyl transferase